MNFSSDTISELLRGLLVTIEVAAAASVLAVLVALIAGTARLSPYFIVRFISGVYVEIFRGTSVLVQLFVVFFVLPFAGVTVEPFTAGVIALGLNVGAYGAEVVRSGVQAVPKGQLEAAAALDLPAWARFRRVVLPSAIVIMLRPAGNLIIDLLKATSLVSLITLEDLTAKGQQLRLETGDSIGVYLTLLVVYFVLSSLVAAGVNLIERRVRRGIDAGQPAASKPRRWWKTPRGPRALKGTSA